MTELDDAAKCEHFDQAAHFDATQTENFPAWNFGPVYTDPVFTVNVKILRRSGCLSYLINAGFTDIFETRFESQKM